jgi:hypothetical protein
MVDERLSDDDFWRLLIGHTVVPFAFSDVSRQWMDWAKVFVLNTAFIPTGHRPDKRTGLDRDTGLALFLYRIMHVMDSLYDGQRPGGHHMPMSHSEPLLRDALSLAACCAGLTVDFSRAINVAMREQWIQGYKLGGIWGTAPIDYTLTNTGMYKARSNAAPPFHDVAKPPFFATGQKYSGASTANAPQVPVNSPAPTAPEQSELPPEGDSYPVVYSVPKPAPMLSGNRQTPTTEESAKAQQSAKAVTPTTQASASVGDVTVHNHINIDFGGLLSSHSTKSSEHQDALVTTQKIPQTPIGQTLPSGRIDHAHVCPDDLANGAKRKLLLWGILFIELCFYVAWGAEIWGEGANLWQKTIASIVFFTIVGCLCRKGFLLHSGEAGKRLLKRWKGED